MLFSPSQILVTTLQSLSHPSLCHPLMTFYQRRSPQMVPQQLPRLPRPPTVIPRSESTMASTTNLYPSTAPSWQPWWLALWPSLSSKGEEVMVRGLSGKVIGHKTQHTEMNVHTFIFNDFICCFSVCELIGPQSGLVQNAIHKRPKAVEFLM